MKASNQPTGIDAEIYERNAYVVKMRTKRRTEPKYDKKNEKSKGY